jgi:hypothetical protein
VIAVDADPVVVFGSVLRALREKAGLSQRELAACPFTGSERDTSACCGG